MSPTRSKWCVAALVITFLAGSDGAAAFGQSDVIRCTNGTEVKGRIDDESYRGVEVDLRHGVKRTLGWNEVAEIDWADAAAFEKAARDAKSGDGAAAVAARNELTALAKSGRLRGPLRQEVLVTLARLDQRRGGGDEALASWRALLADFPNGRYLDEAAEGLVDGLVGKHDLDGATKGLAAVVEAAATAGVEPRFDAVATALRGRICEAGGSFAVARSAYESALKGGALAAPLAARTRLGIARCLLGEGRQEEAKGTLRELVVRDAPAEVLAAAWNGLADLALDDGVKRRDENQITVALYSYLRGVVLYKPEEGERSAEHGRALDGAARAFEYLAELASDPKVKRVDRQRAELLRRTLAAR